MSRRRRAGHIILMAVAFGLLTGFGESLVLAFRLVVMGRVIFVSPHFAWMTPLAYVILFSGPGVAIALLGGLGPRIVRLSYVAFFFTVLTVGSWMLPFTQISRYAGLLLALGIATQVLRWARGRPKGFVRSVRRTALVLGALVCTIMVIQLGRLAWNPDRASGTVNTGQYNVLLIVWDTARAASMSLYGYENRTTPELESFSKRGVVFDRAIATSPWTLPSHASMFTGRHAHELSTDWWVSLNDEHETLAEAFRDGGYATGGFVANHHYCSYDSGLNRGFVHYQDYELSFDQLMTSSWLMQTPIVTKLLASRSVSGVWKSLREFNWSVQPKRNSAPTSAEKTTDRFLDWVDDLGDRPFFAFLNYFNAHQPYTAPVSVRERFIGGTGRVNSYDAAIAFLDQEFARLLNELEQRGQLENTIVIVTSDHGELHGEHDLFGHAHNLYLPVLHVPLVIAVPEEMPHGLRVTNPVSLRDLAATIVDLTALDRTRFPGQSLARFWRGDPVPSDIVEPVLSEVRYADMVEPGFPTSRGPMKSVVTDSMHFILNGDGIVELYNYTNDPVESVNLADRDGGAAAVRFRTILERLLEHGTTP